MDELVGDMVELLTDIQMSCAELVEQKWGTYLSELKEKMHNLEETDPEAVMTRALLKNIYGKFEGYLAQLRMLGFNSDLSLIKQKLAKHLNMHEQQHGFVVKKPSAYACISTDKFRFLDISHFLTAGTSYAGFLKAYRVEETKGFFPYEWLDSVAKLDCTELPPNDAFYSALKGTNISEEDYAFCQKVWTDRSMGTFKDFLMWYNNLDVGPFVMAVERLQTFYFDKGIDVLKSAMSVSSIARQLLFEPARDQRAEFALIDKRNADHYDTIKDKANCTVPYE